mmetsp:Transcript_41165/g.96159  ORF Transcript_41165/g.96159 Transcript_41165/m.96159 type:complete len:291 (-) Transcript_41165:651-1523(-)
MLLQRRDFLHLLAVLCGSESTVEAVDILVAELHIACCSMRSRALMRRSICCSNCSAPGPLRHSSIDSLIDHRTRRLATRFTEAEPAYAAEMTLIMYSTSDESGAGSRETMHALTAAGEPRQTSAQSATVASGSPLPTAPTSAPEMPPAARSSRDMCTSAVSSSLVEVTPLLSSAVDAQRIASRQKLCTWPCISRRIVIVSMPTCAVPRKVASHCVCSGQLPSTSTKLSHCGSVGCAVAMRSGCRFARALTKESGMNELELPMSVIGRACSSIWAMMLCFKGSSSTTDSCT